MSSIRLRPLRPAMPLLPTSSGAGAYAYGEVSVARRGMPVLLRRLTKFKSMVSRAPERSAERGVRGETGTCVPWCAQAAGAPTGRWPGCQGQGVEGKWQSEEKWEPARSGSSSAGLDFSLTAELSAGDRQIERMVEFTSVPEGTAATHRSAKLAPLV